MARSKHSKEEIEKAYNFYEELKSLSKVSEITGIHRRTLSDNFDKYGFIYDKKKPTTPILLSDEQVYLAYEMYLNGDSSIVLSDKFNVDFKTILKSFKRLGLKVRSNKENSRKYFVNDNYFETIDTEEKAYWLGFIYADGYVSVRKCGQKTFGVALSSIDEELLIKLNKSLDSTYPIKRYFTSGNNEYKSVEYSRILITSDKLVDDLINLGVLENKTNIIKPPSIKEEFIKHFIRGYMDGDGTISKSLSNYYVGFLGTDDILNYISNYLISHDLIKRINKFEKRKEGQVVSSVRYGGNIQAQRILDHLYEDSSIWLERKHNVYKELKQYNCRSYK
jgi:hypothetical protein